MEGKHADEVCEQFHTLLTRVNKERPGQTDIQADLEPQIPDERADITSA